MRWLVLLPATVCLAGWAAPAVAAQLDVTVVTPAGAPVADAVVMVRPDGAGPRGPIRFAWPYVMGQRKKAFEPFVLIVPVGAEVAFPNFDPFRHHVYSFSPAKRFELKLYGHDETRVVRFDKAGVVAVGCNIHDNMSAFIRVVDTPFAIKTGADGKAVIRDLPAGPVTVTIWHPYLKTPELVRRAVAPAAGGVSLKAPADVRSAPMPHGGY